MWPFKKKSDIAPNGLPHVTKVAFPSTIFASFHVENVGWIQGHFSRTDGTYRLFRHGDLSGVEGRILDEADALVGEMLRKCLAQMDRVETIK